MSAGKISVKTAIILTGTALCALVGRTSAAKHITSENNAISAINMDTAVILKVKDGYADTAAALIQERFEQTGGYSLSYGYDPYRTEQARLFVNGNYVAFLILGEEPDNTESEDEHRKFAAAEGEKVDVAWEKIFGEKPVNIVKLPKPYDTDGMDGMVG